MAASCPQLLATRVPLRGHVNLSSGNEFGRLTPDLLLRVFAFLDSRTLAWCAAVCSEWHNVVKNSPAVWKELCERRLRLSGFQFNRKPPENRAVGGEVLTGNDNSNDGIKAAKTADKAMNGEKEGGNVTLVDWKAVIVDVEHKQRWRCGRVNVHTLKGHAGRVTCCRMFMDRIVSGSADETIRLWSARSGRWIATYRSPVRAPVEDLDFDDHKIVAALGTEVGILKRGTGKWIRRISCSPQRINTLCYEEEDLIVGCEDGTVRLFDLYSGSCKSIWRRHPGGVECVRMSGENHIVASGGRDGTVQLYDVETSERLAVLRPPDPMAGVTCLHMDADARRVFAGGAGGAVLCWDLRYASLVWQSRPYSSMVTDLHCQAYGASTVVSSGITGILHVLDATNGAFVRTLARPELHHRNMAVPSGGSRVSQGGRSAGRNGVRSTGSTACADSGLTRDASRAGSGGDWRGIGQGGSGAEAGLARMQLPSWGSMGSASGGGRSQGVPTAIAPMAVAEEPSLDEQARNMPHVPVLCVRIGMSKAVTAHVDHTLGLWHIGRP
ncbi:hypothetical protein CBR_g46897 [Chara braunii]|uniref:F-box domain-containing protein n=1 Tax=Chara braunii TaxID=69332 RepID=A0A388M187_CHABU|nr:hypothetical protein CBR_g46897 [Chara braunii]|eukprot:GBG88330.1 hypothetical protein CBR_g46897 [Chara braunii]